MAHQDSNLGGEQSIQHRELFQHVEDFLMFEKAGMRPHKVN